MNRIFAFVLLAFGFASAAHAVPMTWTDSIDFGGKYLKEGDAYLYNHDLNDNGFRPLDDLITGFSLAINLADDSRRDGSEEARIYTLSGLIGEVVNFGSSVDYVGGYSFWGWVQLNTLGELTVGIRSSEGDFNLISSTLTAWGNGRAANVPEPGALGLLGIGLLGIALSKRRRKQVA